ncbi:hypothetical protein BKA64DRAFT_717315 [Cadophora sp. MPI-SDFR-AT-0126]|nr:hypothetical protein BKA64DRAFT_717315 [Leotiomycetes sp. MPI-SDFR-AT-0126]
MRDILIAGALWWLVLTKPETIGLVITIEDFTNPQRVPLLSMIYETPPLLSGTEDSNRKELVLKKVDDKIDRYRGMNSAALYMIQNTVEVTQFDYVANCLTAYDAWHTLERIHKGKGGVKLMSLYREFISLRHSSDSVNKVASTLTRLQEQIGDLDKANKPTDFMKTYRLMEIFEGEESMKT